jgi:hypothetical protein
MEARSRVANKSAYHIYLRGHNQHIQRRHEWDRIDRTNHYLIDFGTDKILVQADG